MEIKVNECCTKTYTGKMGFHHRHFVFPMVSKIGVLLLFTFLVGASDINETSASTEKPKLEQPVENSAPQVRYRNRPVAAFQSGSKPSNSNSTSNSSDTDGPDAAGAPFITVHDLTSQTFEKLHENWRNLEALIRNYQTRKTQEESLQRSSPNGGIPPQTLTGDRETVRRPPYNNVYTFRYHPVVLQGEGSSSVDDIVGNSRHGPARTWNNGISFNPFPYDPKGEGSKDVDMDRHTVATMYTIGICLVIMVIGSMMFILINRCDGSGGNYSRASASSRLTSRVMAIGRTGRQANSGNNGRTRNGRSGGRTNPTVQNPSSSGSSQNSSSAKYATDLPPSYASLFPEGEPKQLPNSNENNVAAPVNAESSTINLNSSSNSTDTSGQSDNSSDRCPTTVATAT